MARMRLTAKLSSVLLVLVLGGCQCGGPPTGECTGVLGGVTFTETTIDPDSRYVTVYPKTCSESSLKKYDVSWGKGTASLAFSFTSSGPSVLSEKTHSLPATDL